MKNYSCDVFATIRSTVAVNAESINEVAQKALAVTLLEAQEPGNNVIGNVVTRVRDKVYDAYDLLDMRDLIAERLCADDDILDEDFLTEILRATVDVAREREDLSPEEIADGVLKAAADSLDD